MNGNINDIVLICPNFNQRGYLIGMINQFKHYYPNNPIVVIDNGSTYQALIDTYADRLLEKMFNAIVVRYAENDFVGNLNHCLSSLQSEYYILSDVDLQISASVPPNFLEIFKTAIDVYGFHHAGFGLIVDDIPAWNPKAGWIQGDEKALLNAPVTITHEGKEYTGFRAPIDTTFALYKRDNGGWAAPMPPKAWDNSVRLFGVHHLPWYLHKDYLNDEMKNYFATCKGRDNSLPSAGRNHYKPE